jgi:hypothetical protein
VDEQHIDHSDDERLVRASLLAAYPPTRSPFSQRRGEQIVRAAALEQLHHRRPSTGGRVAASVAAAFTLLAGTASAAGAALPGHPLYPLKRVIERAMVAVTSDDGDAARLELRFAERRLDEASVMGTEEPVATSLAENFNEHIDAATALGGHDISDEIEQLQRTRRIPGTDTTVDGSSTDDAPARRPAAIVGRSPEPTPSPTPGASPAPTPTPSPSPSPSPTAGPTTVPSDQPDGLPTLPVDPSELAPPDHGDAPSHAPRTEGRGRRAGG